VMPFVDRVLATHFTLSVSVFGSGAVSFALISMVADFGEVLQIFQCYFTVHEKCFSNVFPLFFGVSVGQWRLNRGPAPKKATEDLYTEKKRKCLVGIFIEPLVCTKKVWFFIRSYFVNKKLL